MTAERNILLVDDEEPVRNVWARFLERWGLSYDLAACGNQALTLARTNRYHLLLTDLTMPEMSGQELIRTLRAEQPDLQIIAVTGYGTVEVAVETMKAGALDFITKPINFPHAEMVLRKSLEQAQAQRETARLRRLAHDLEALNELKEKFIAITNHELRTPVGTIRNIVEILEREFRDGEEGLLVSMLSRATTQLVEIVNQMHEISSAKSEGLVLRPSSFSLAELCHELAGEWWLRLQGRRQRLSLAVPDKLSITADRVKLKKVLRELVQNAVKFTQDGGNIAIEAALREEGLVAVSVSDDGVGIPPEHLPRIFELFYEAAPTLQHHSSNTDFLGGGMGVGLSIVQDIVKAHRGTVEVTSTLGEGSRFTLNLPQHGPAWEGGDAPGGGR